jgi:hypothetical protein
VAVGIALSDKALTTSPPVTEPTTPLLTTFGPPPVPFSPVEFPLGWLLNRASAPIQYRSIVEVARLGSGANGGLSALPYSYRPAITLALAQRSDGIWNDSMLGVPSGRADRFEGIGTITAVRRLLEYGWDRESPPLILARRTLFRLLAEDDDAAFLFELGTRHPDPDMARRGRAILREAAAAALAHAGYEGDPRLRGAARRILDRIDTYLRSPLAQKPWIRVGNKQVLAGEAAPPSIYALEMLAHMPLFRNEHHVELDHIYQHVSQSPPRQEPQQLCGDKIAHQPHLVLGDRLSSRSIVDADIPAALMWLELMARLNFLRRNETWTKMFERFLDERDRDYVWRPHKGISIPRPADPAVWPSFPLEEHLSGDERLTDVTFRLGLIARLAGRQIEIV